MHHKYSLRFCRRWYFCSTRQTHDETFSLKILKNECTNIVMETVENQFGILPNCWRVFGSVILLIPETVRNLVKAKFSSYTIVWKRVHHKVSTALQDLLIQKHLREKLSLGHEDLRTSDLMLPLEKSRHGNNTVVEPKHILNEFMEYFSLEKL